MHSSIVKGEGEGEDVDGRRKCLLSRCENKFEKKPVKPTDRYDFGVKNEERANNDFRIEEGREILGASLPNSRMAI